MQVGEGQSFNQFIGVLKVALAFAGETHNHIGPHPGVGERLNGGLDAVGILLARIPASHPPQDTIRTRLQRRMHMPCDPRARRQQRQELVGQIRGLQ